MYIHNSTQSIPVFVRFSIAQLTHEYNCIQGICTHKDFQRPYTSVDHGQLKVNMFIGTIICNSELIVYGHFLSV